MSKEPPHYVFPTGRHTPILRGTSDVLGSDSGPEDRLGEEFGVNGDGIVLPFTF